MMDERRERKPLLVTDEEAKGLIEVARLAEHIILRGERDKWKAASTASRIKIGAVVVSTISLLATIGFKVADIWFVK